jgi:aspergillopepsin I
VTDLRKNATIGLSSIEGGQVFSAAVTVGGQDFEVVIDTGSSDPWLAVNNFECLDPNDDSSQDPEYCEFGPTYDPTRSTTYSVVSDQNFNITYADGEYLNGAMGFENFTMAGITVPQQKFGVVDTAAWYGDGVSSGLIGFAYRTLTSAFAGANPAGDRGARPLLYNPLFANMYQQQSVPPVFSVVINRDAEEGGLLALGGIPDVQTSGAFYRAPIQPVGVNASDGTLVYEFYTIDVDGFAFAPNASVMFNPYDTPNPRKQPLAGRGSDVIIDSGTSLCYVPDDVAAATAALFNPPAFFDSSLGAYFVDCAARAPVFGVCIAKKIMYVNALDLIVQLSPNMCVMGVQPNGGGLNILGGTFMKNVLTVFDIGAGELRFSPRTYYSLYRVGS